MGHRAARDAVVAAAVTALAYLLFLRHRTDYAGHYLAGFGATLLLLCVLGAVRRDKFKWDALVVTIIAIGLGGITESTIFRVALFDPVDFCNQSLGAVVACACILGTPRETRAIIEFGVVAAIVVVGGFVFAFA